jgi:hypothetical protein
VPAALVDAQALLDSAAAVIVAGIVIMLSDRT